MKNTISKIVFGLSWVALAATALLTLLCFSVAIDHDGRGGVFTRTLVNPIWACTLLALLILPSSLLFLRGHQRRDLWSLVLSGVCFVGVLGETLALYNVPLHGPW